jgi:uncharacterized OsmC-like protein
MTTTMDAASEDVAQALRRAEAVLQRRPEVGLHDDAPATSRWRSGTQAVAYHANGTQITSDMPNEFGGGGAHVTPGWLLRAGVASCTTTCIAMHAALQGIALDSLEVEVGSRSDSRGLLGMADAGGAPVPAGPCEMRLQVRIAARGVAPQRLRALVEHGNACSPMGFAMRESVPIDLRIEVASD